VLPWVRIPPSPPVYRGFTGLPINPYRRFPAFHSFLTTSHSTCATIMQ